MGNSNFFQYGQDLLDLKKAFFLVKFLDQMTSYILTFEQHINRNMFTLIPARPIYNRRIFIATEETVERLSNTFIN